MSTIIVGRNGKETVKLLAEKTDSNVEAMYTLRSGKRVWRTNFIKQRIGYKPNITDGVVINWAFQNDVANGDAIVYNADGICKASNKPLARRLLAEAGVPVPETTSDVNTAQVWLRDGSTIISRPIHHHGGLDFFVTKPPTQALPTGGYYQKFFRKTKEFRVHVAHGKVLVLQEKVPNEETTVDFDEARPWNHATGDFTFSTVRWSDYKHGVCRVAVDSVSVLGLDFGAVDILWNEEEGAVVCEVNTSPSLADYSSDRYAKYFNWLSRSMERRVHHCSEGFSTGKDFAWRNYELADEERPSA